MSIGGDGSLSIAQQFHEHGIPIVGVPKTIDNDLDGTLMTFGFDSAVACATDALDRLHTTAESHRRVMVLEVMGRYAGWIAIYAGVAGGADVILIPEIPFNYESIAAQDQGARGARQAFHDRGRRRRRPRARRRFRHGRRRAGKSRSPARRHRRRRGEGDRSSAPAKKHGCAFWATCNAAAARPPSTAPFAPSSAPKRSS